MIPLLPSQAGSAYGQEPPITHSPSEVQDYENQLNNGRGLDPDGRQVSHVERTGPEETKMDQSDGTRKETGEREPTG